MKAIAISVLMAVAFSVSAQANLESVQDIYAKFGQGDVPGIIAKLSDNVEWVHGADPSVVPFGGVRQGKTGAIEFFQLLGQNANITLFQPSNFRVDGNKVMNDVRVEAIALATGKAYIENSVFTFEIDANGKVVRWEAAGDFASVNAAFSK